MLLNEREMAVGRKRNSSINAGKLPHSDPSRSILIVSLLQYKVTAVEPDIVGPVNDNREIAEVGRAVGVCRKEVIGVFGLE